MTKNPIILVVIVAVLGLGFLSLSKDTPEPDAMMENGLEAEMENKEQQNDLMEKLPEDLMEKEEGVMMEDKMSDSRYVEYSSESFEKASSNRRVLFFYASWCPTCIPTDANLMENESMIPEDVTVLRVNYDDPETDQEEVALATKYGVTYQHTFVQIDADGNQVATWNGGNIEELLTNVK